MDYLYEQLDENRFQQFCQALLIKEFPNLQCFPLNQPDGGRDALVMIGQGDIEEFIVFQVKYVRQPQIIEPHNWLVKIMKDEAPKVNKLIPRGAKQYYLLTNVSGTAHLDKGAIDKLQTILDDSIEIPAQCWWRDDLSRRLDNRLDLKWSYTELLSGKDIMQMLLLDGRGEENQRRTLAVRKYINRQYENERDIKFKQILLSNNLLDLFVDIPITKRDVNNRNRSFMHRVKAFQESSLVEDYILVDLDSMLPWEEKKRGAAELLLNPKQSLKSNYLVIEGAPGQGKSTITQYVCQVHRMRILNKEHEIRRIPEAHRDRAVQIPLKVDLRDFAIWIAKQNPFESSDERHKTPPNWHPSLEAFLAAQIRYLSGGIEFGIPDLYAIIRISSVILVLDAFDEVPEIEARRELVRIVEEGLRLLEEDAVFLQVIVTTRPAAFANSPGFSPNVFTYLELETLPTPVIEEYANKWIKARRLNEQDATELKTILSERLDQPHLRELARNPMQLAILLSLIHSRGASLPDKRTALYDSYIDIFFTREVEKSPVVRKHRDTLINIHRYLAWLLHSEAEMGSNGAISEENLRIILTEYLRNQGFDIAIVNDVFAGTVQRVGVLVSRIEGLFEFEVQPLREYFAARFLYETAPYSPTGAEKSGTLTDRFMAISQNFYWLNVTRFFAGCFTDGELSSLVDMLAELFEYQGYKFLRHPRDLATMLLTDWVFAQFPKAMRRMVDTILADTSFRYILPANASRFRRQNGLQLPENLGRESLSVSLIERLKSYPPDELAYQMAQVIKRNLSPKEIRQVWNQTYSDCDTQNVLQWCKYGLYLGIFQNLPITDLENILSDDKADSNDKLLIIYQSGNVELFQNSLELNTIVLTAILDDPYRFQNTFNDDTLISVPKLERELDFLVYIFNLLRLIFTSSLGSETIFSLPPLGNKFDNPIEMLSQMRKEKYVLESIGQLTEYFFNLLQQNKPLGARYQTELVEKSIELWGERWLSYIWAVQTVIEGKKAKKSEPNTSNILLDSSTPLLSRVQYASAKRNSPKWWQNQIKDIKTDTQSIFFCYLVLSIGMIELIVTIIQDIDNIISKLSDNDWERLCKALHQRILRLSEGKVKGISSHISQLPKELNIRTIVALGFRMNLGNTLYLFDNYLNQYDGDDVYILEFCQRAATAKIFLGNYKRYYLEIIQKAYLYGAKTNQLALENTDSGKLTLAMAQEILEEPNNYPLEIIEHAERIYRNVVTSTVKPVRLIAIEQNWLDQHL